MEFPNCEKDNFDDIKLYITLSDVLSIIYIDENLIAFIVVGAFSVKLGPRRSH